MLFKIYGNKEEILPAIKDFVEVFNKQIEEIQDKELTVFGKKTGVKFSKILPYGFMTYEEDVDCVKVNLTVPIPDFVLSIKKKTLIKQFENYFKSKNIKAKIE